MEFKESAAIENAERKLSFPFINWLNKQKFEEYIKTNTPINPHQETDGNNRIFVGKSIPHTSDNATQLEVIGTVLKLFETGEWVLQVSHSSTVFEIKSDFLVLNIEDTETFQWIRTSEDNIPRYALRGAIDYLTKEYFYIGRAIQTVKPKYFRENGFNWFNETVPYLFGKVHVTHHCLYAPFNGLELMFNEYEILCLKPTPNSLKIITRELVRSMAKNSNENIELINTNSNGLIYVPNVLINNLIKYPSYLSVGEYLLKNERIVREDGKFEMLILNTGELVIRSIIKNDDERTLSKEMLNNLKDTQFQRIISKSVSSVWLHRFQVSIHYKDWRNQKKIHVFKSFSNEMPDYRLMISDGDMPDLVVRIEDNIKSNNSADTSNSDNYDDYSRYLAYQPI